MSVQCRTIPIYDVDIYLATDLAEAKTFVREKSFMEFDEAKNLDRCRGVCYTVTDNLGRDYRMLCVFEGGLPIIVHECVHMAWIILRTCGVRISPSNDEPLAYLTAWLVGEFLGLHDLVVS